MQSTGSLSKIYDGWRKRLIRSAAHLEAYIDFAEDENIEDDVVVQLTSELKKILAEIKEHLNDQRKGEILRDGVLTAIVGAPNVGKSSFLNLICQRDISIVTDKAGTTRDIIESTYNIGGYPVRFADTAGLRQFTEDKIEEQGIMRTKQCMEQADLVLIMLDAVCLKNLQIYDVKSLEDYLLSYFIELGVSPDILSNKNTQLIVNKTDLLSEEEYIKIQQITKVLVLSCKDTSNFKGFLNQFEDLLKSL